VVYTKKKKNRSLEEMGYERDSEIMGQKNINKTIHGSSIYYRKLLNVKKLCYV
jgi:hypothetical protein